MSSDMRRVRADDAALIVMWVHLPFYDRKHIERAIRDQDANMTLTFPCFLTLISTTRVIFGYIHFKFSCKPSK